MKIDLHMHSKYSFDSKMEIPEIVNYALKKNIKYIAITDHIEFKYDRLNKILYKLDERQKEIEKYNEIYQGDVKILNGIELGSPHLFEQEIEKLHYYNDFDIVLGSIHMIDYTTMTRLLRDYGYTEEEIIEKYLDDMKQLIKNKYVDIIAHFDYYKKYTKQEYFNKEILEPIIKELIENDKILEINTSANRRLDLLSFPNYDILNLYSELGGKYVTIGSDAHEYNELFDNIDQFDNYLNKNNLEKVVIENRKIKVI